MRWVLFPSALAAAAAGPAPGPGSGAWRVATPSQHGLNASALKAADDYIGAHARQRACLTIVKDGEIVYEAGDTAKKAHVGYSMMKTFGALMVGVAVGDGAVDVDADITAAYNVTSPRPYPVTSAEIMSQALGGAAAGQSFAYDVAGTKWLDRLNDVIAAATGHAAEDIYHSRVGPALGLPAGFWPQGSGTCRDWARVGQLLLNRGAWGAAGTQLVPASFVGAMTSPQKYGSFDYSNPCYGYCMWLNTDRSQYKTKCVSDTPGELTPFPAGAPHDVAMLAGFEGQITLVIPSHNAVVVSLGTTLGIGGYTGTQVGPVIYEGLCKGKVFGDIC